MLPLFKTVGYCTILKVENNGPMVSAGRRRIQKEEAGEERRL
jgi:hypothetical protein